MYFLKGGKSPTQHYQFVTYSNCTLQFTCAAKPCILHLQLQVTYLLLICFQDFPELLRILSIIITRRLFHHRCCNVIVVRSQEALLRLLKVYHFSEFNIIE
ncbi:unnamed protein product [Allacma fusca]|uniref:Uncharacterized protein n=1 Tax=Allacma fusca TaxID=39272 RepID=A0A8J2L259_9HEXA|nr:unnamed protein product [Allacma fusca]